MPYPQIVLDANVIVQALVRDLLLDADAHGLCRVRWTEAILAEARRTLVGDFGRDPARIDALLAAMRQHFPRAAIVGYEDLRAAMANDPKDRHVAAAAVRAGADIATFNLRHFRPAALAPFAIRAVHPDAFLMELSSAHPDTFAAIVREQAAQRQNPPLAIATYLDKLIVPLPRFAAAIRVRVIPAPLNADHDSRPPGCSCMEWACIRGA